VETRRCGFRLIWNGLSAAAGFYHIGEKTRGDIHHGHQVGSQGMGSTDPWDLSAMSFGLKEQNTGKKGEDESSKAGPFFTLRLRG